MRILYDIIEEFPLFYFYLTKIKYFFGNKNYYSKIVCPSSHIYIDGFPRSSNSFTRKLFRFLNPKLNITGHFHSHAHTLIAIKFNIPSVILIRQPCDAIKSVVAFSILKYFHIFKKSPYIIRYIYIYILFCYWSFRYYRYYSVILLNKSKLHILNFDEIINNTYETFSECSNKFNLKLNLDDFNTIHKRVANHSRDHVMPSTVRDTIKASINPFIANHLNFFYFRCCNSVYRKIT